MTAAPHPQVLERLERLKGYLAVDPANVSLLEEAADAALMSGLKPEAIALLDRALVLEPASPSLRFKKGNVLLASGNYPDAQQAFQQLVDSGNYHPAITYNLAYAAFAMGHPSEALKQLDSIDPANLRELPQFELLYARALYHSQNYARALEHVDRYLTIQPEDPEGLGLKAMLLYDTNENDPAAAIAERLLARQADDIMANLVMGSIALEKRDGAVAHAHFKRVVDRDGNAGRAWSGLAFAALLETRIDDAASSFETAVKHMPNHLGTWHGLAWTQIMKRDFAGARAAVDAAMALDRTFSENHGTLAVLLVLEGRTVEAEAEAKRGMRLNPRSAASHFARSLLMAQAGDSSGSQRLVNKILSGTGLQDQGNVAEAILNMAGIPTKQGSGSKPPQGH